MMLAASAFAACATSSYGSASGMVDLDAYPIPALSAADLQMLRGMSDADILGHLATVDSLEIVTADSLVRISKTSDVVDYAKMMHLAHATSREQAREIARQQDITPLTLVGGLRASSVAAKLDSVRFASDLTVDRHYIMSQIALHERVLGELEALDDVARNSVVRDHLKNLQPVIRDHLARAHAIAVAKGFQKKR